MTASTLLAQLLATRLCHDLAGPVGAVAAGVELVGDDPSLVDQETLSLIAASSAAASRKLKLLRTAFGTTAQSSPAALIELEGAARGYFEAIAGPSGAVGLGWPDTAQLIALQERCGPAAVPILLNTILVAAEAAPRARRFTISILADNTGHAEIGVAAEQAAGATRADIIEAVANPDTVLASARNAQALYWAALCRDNGARAAIESGENGLMAVARFQSP